MALTFPKVQGPPPRDVRGAFRALLDTYGVPRLLQILTDDRADRDHWLRAADLLARYGVGATLGLEGQDGDVSGVVFMPALDPVPDPLAMAEPMIPGHDAPAMIPDGASMLEIPAA